MWWGNGGEDRLEVTNSRARAGSTRGCMYGLNHTGVAPKNV